jgi:hypothetical protein
VASSVFLGRPYVQHGDAALAHTTQQFFAGNRLKRIAGSQEAGCKSAQLGQAGIRKLPGEVQEFQNLRIRNPILDEQPMLVGVHQPCAKEYSQVLGRIGDADSGMARDYLYRTGSLTKQFQQLQPGWGADRLSDSRQLRVHGIFELARRRTHAGQYSRSHLNMQIPNVAEPAGRTGTVALL